ncbi:hypothetical protein BV22DRAFT_446806 [Leucogyrophana mollusca]|uniref:Uncharacterized protein n=1 Tax=Leucogyrophana mollusca TaxID=85980 RepID=A0ACB8BKF2_9AGAM|nr:hypothetical protein BV22DRAFT_446806 [Leucogyrophana mollusca]
MHHHLTPFFAPRTPSFSGKGTMQALPAEIVLQIMQDMHREDLRECLRVSCLWHNLAVGLLFRTVHLYFGCWGDQYIRGGAQEFSAEQVVRLTSDNWEVLDHISSNPTFASAVKQIVVHAYDDSLCIYEKACLSKALKALPYLLSFDWHSTRRAASADSEPNIKLLRALSQSCPQLRHLGLPALLYSGDIVDSFGHLWSISITPLCDGPFLDPDTSEVVVGLDRIPFVDDGEAFRNKTTQTLRRLQLVDCLLGATPIHIFIQLTELNLVRPGDLGGLNLILRHAACLEALGLHDVSDPEVYSVLSSNADALPFLKSFMLSSGDGLSPTHAKNLHKFLLGRSCMRRLCINVEMCYTELSIVVLSINSMKELEALGLSISGGGFSQTSSVAPEDSDIWIKYIPQSLQAIMLSVSGCEDELAVIFQGFSKLPSLTFVYLPDSDLYGGYAGGLPPAQHIVDELPRLTCVGSSRDICDVRRTASGVELLHWTQMKIDTRGQDDFSNVHGAWLLRHNLWLDLRSPVEAFCYGGF